MKTLSSRALHDVLRSADSAVPHDEFTERFVTGCRLLTPTAEPYPLTLFFCRDLRCLNYALNLLREAGQLTADAAENSVRLLRELYRRGWLETAGGPARLDEAMGCVTHLEFLPDYLDRLRQLRFRRNAVTHGEAICVTARQTCGDIADLYTLLQQGVSDE